MSLALKTLVAVAFLVPGPGPQDHGAAPGTPPAGGQAAPDAGAQGASGQSEHLPEHTPPGLTPAEQLNSLYDHLSPHAYRHGEPYLVLGGDAHDPDLPKFLSRSFWPLRLYWTNHHVAILVSALVVLIAFGWLAARRRKHALARGPLENCLEALVLFVRDDMVYKSMGEHHGKRFLPLFLTQFFCILVMNLLGILPNFDFFRSLHFPTTATANLMVTAGLALTTLTAILYAGIKEQGFGHYFVGLAPAINLGSTPGMKALRVVILGIMYPIEAFGLLIKPIALTVRLFANMTGGHLAMLTVYGLIYLFHSWAVAPVGIAFNVFLFFLETMVAFIQAYIFTYLSILFVGAAVHPEH